MFIIKVKVTQSGTVNYLTSRLIYKVFLNDYNFNELKKYIYYKLNAYFRSPITPIFSLALILSNVHSHLRDIGANYLF